MDTDFAEACPQKTVLMHLASTTQVWPRYASPESTASCPYKDPRAHLLAARQPEDPQDLLPASEHGQGADAPHHAAAGEEKRAGSNVGWASTVGAQATRPSGLLPWGVLCTMPAAVHASTTLLWGETAAVTAPPAHTLHCPHRLLTH